jgi:hypothetical protein
MLYTSPWVGFLTTLVVIGTDCTGSCKSNYYTITTTMVAPVIMWASIYIRIDYTLVSISSDSIINLAYILSDCSIYYLFFQLKFLFYEILSCFYKYIVVGMKCGNFHFNKNSKIRIYTMYINLVQSTFCHHNPIKRLLLEMWNVCLYEHHGDRHWLHR